MRGIPWAAALWVYIASSSSPGPISRSPCTTSSFAPPFTFLYSPKTRNMARLDAILDRQHRDVLDRAVRNILGTGLALKTCAQIADGLPLASVAYDEYRCTRPAGHPISGHTSLCPGAEGTARYFLERFGIGMVDFDDKISRVTKLDSCSRYYHVPFNHGSYSWPTNLLHLAIAASTAGSSNSWL